MGSHVAPIRLSYWCLLGLNSAVWGIFAPWRATLDGLMAGIQMPVPFHIFLSIWTPNQCWRPQVLSLDIGTPMGSQQ